MVNYTEKLLCIEVLEKISRMQRFLLSEPDASRRQGTEVIGVFLKALEGILDNLAPILARLSKDLELEKWERVAIVRRLSDIFNSVDELHAQLQFVYGAWVRPETYVFIRNVLEFIPSDRRPKKVSVILSNRYSFEESDLSSYFEYVLSTTNIPVDFKSESPTVFLPKIERDNPLNWAILAHECGHIDHEGIKNVLQQPEIIPTEANTRERDILLRWAEEIYCDLLATKILGPAYLASFATFAFIVAGTGGSEIHTETHPADIVRVCIIQEVLQKNDLKVDMTKQRLNCDDVASFFYNLLEERTKLDRKYFHLTAQQPQPPLRLQEFVDAICEQVDRVALNRQLTLKDFARIGSLSKRLSKGIIIGSYQKSGVTKQVEENFSKKRFDPQKLNEAKEAVQESRTLLWEIVNAGWLHKIESVYPSALELFFTPNATLLKEKLISWGEEIESIDRLLLKSIESSEIQKLMEE